MLFPLHVSANPPNIQFIVIEVQDNIQIFTFDKNVLGGYSLNICQNKYQNYFFCLTTDQELFQVYWL